MLFLVTLTTIQSGKLYTTNIHKHFITTLQLLSRYIMFVTHGIGEVLGYTFFIGLEIKVITKYYNKIKSKTI